MQATVFQSVHWLKTNALLEKTLELKVVMEARVIQAMILIGRKRERKQQTLWGWIW